MTTRTTRTPEQLDALDHITERHCQALAVLDSLVISLGFDDDLHDPRLTLIKNTALHEIPWDF